MGGLSLITKGMLTSNNITVKYIIPYNIQIKDKSKITLDIQNKNCLNLNLSNIIDKQVNIKIDENQINIKKNLDTQINLKN